jgi:hypothetical protein
MQVAVEVTVRLADDERFRVEARTSYSGTVCIVMVEAVVMRSGHDFAWVSGRKVTKAGTLGQYTNRASVFVANLPREIRAERPANVLSPT